MHASLPLSTVFYSLGDCNPASLEFFSSFASAFLLSHGFRPFGSLVLSLCGLQLVSVKSTCILKENRTLAFYTHLSMSLCCPFTCPMTLAKTLCTLDFHLQNEEMGKMPSTFPSSSCCCLDLSQSKALSSHQWTVDSGFLMEFEGNQNGWSIAKRQIGLFKNLEGWFRRKQSFISCGFFSEWLLRSVWRVWTKMLQQVEVLFTLFKVHLTCPRF